MRLGAARASPLAKDLRPRGALPGKEFFKFERRSRLALEELINRFCRKEMAARPPLGGHSASTQNCIGEDFNVET
jgi:hypothetical protein